MKIEALRGKIMHAIFESTAMESSPCLSPESMSALVPSHRRPRDISDEEKLICRTSHMGGAGHTPAA